MTEPSGEQRPAVERLAEAAQAALGPGVPLRQPSPAPPAPPPPPVEAPVAVPAGEEKSSPKNSRLKAKGPILLLAGIGFVLIVLLAFWYRWPSSWRTVTAEPVLATSFVMTQAQVDKTVSDAVQPLKAEISRIAQELKNLRSEFEEDKSRVNNLLKTFDGRVAETVRQNIDLTTRLAVAEKSASELVAKVGALVTENARLSAESQTARNQAAEAAAKIKTLEARLATLEARKGTEQPAEQKPREEAAPPLTPRGVIKSSRP